MNDPTLMSIVQGSRQVLCHLRRVTRWLRGIRELLLKAAARRILEHEIAETVELAHFVDLDDIGVLESSCGFRLVAKSCGDLGVRIDLGANHLQAPLADSDEPGGPCRLRSYPPAPECPGLCIPVPAGLPTPRHDPCAVLLLQAGFRLGRGFREGAMESELSPQPFGEAGKRQKNSSSLGDSPSDSRTRYSP